MSGGGREAPKGRARSTNDTRFSPVYSYAWLPDRPAGRDYDPGVKTAIVLMAYGSPSRLEDVPAYLEDIRGGRSSSPGVLQHLIERYRGIGGSPLNEITERQRAALEREPEGRPSSLG